MVSKSGNQKGGGYGSRQHVEKACANRHWLTQHQSGRCWPAWSKAGLTCHAWRRKFVSWRASAQRPFVPASPIWQSGGSECGEGRMRHWAHDLQNRFARNARQRRCWQPAPARPRHSFGLWTRLSQTGQPAPVFRHRRRLLSKGERYGPSSLR